MNPPEKKFLGTPLYRVLVKKAEGKKPLGRPRRRWEDNKQIDIKTGRESVEYINLAQYSNKFWAVLKRYSAREFKIQKKKTQYCLLLWKPNAFANASERFKSNDIWVGAG